MAELRESIVDPVELVDKLNLPTGFHVRSNPDLHEESNTTNSINSISKIPAGLVRFINKIEQPEKDEDQSDVSQSIPDQLDDYYTSLSDMVETIHADHLLLNKSMNVISHTISTVKLDIGEMRDTYVNDIDTIKKEIAVLKRMIHDNRNTFLMALDQNIKAIKVRLDTLEKKGSAF